MLPSPTSPSLRDRLNATQRSIPPGSHDRDAITFAIEHLEEFEGMEFLRDYVAGNLEPWPEYTAYLAERTGGSS